jgi:hypothetical protein
MRPAQQEDDMKTESKKDHDKDNPNAPIGEAPGADLVSRPEKSEQGGSAPGAELAPRPHVGPKAPTTMDAARREERASSEAKSRTSRRELEGEPVTPGCVRCRVTGSAIKYHGKMYEAGKVADFDKVTQREMAHILVPIDQDGFENDAQE